MAAIRSCTVHAIFRWTALIAGLAILVSALLRADPDWLGVLLGGVIAAMYWLLPRPRGACTTPPPD